jgi:phosphoglycolate phosphatase
VTTTPIEGAAVQLVVFDLMGTLVVDDGVVERAYGRALELAGLRQGTDAFYKAIERIETLRGRPTLIVLTELLGDPVLAEEATWAFDESILDEVPTLRPIEGTEAVLSALHAQGVLTALTTSFTPEVRRAALSALQWQGTFAATLSAHGVRRGHPAPDLLLEAILELRIDSVAQVAIVGDTAADLEAGNRAGAGLVIGVRSGQAAPESLLEAPHTHLIDSVADLLPVLASERTVGHRRTSDR